MGHTGTVTGFRSCFGVPLTGNILRNFTSLQVRMWDDTASVEEKSFSTIESLLGIKGKGNNKYNNRKSKERLMKIFMSKSSS